MSYSVYKYTFPDGKVYIGMTHVSLAERRDNGYNHNKPLKEAMRICGWRAIKKTILADNLTQEEAYAREIDEIARHDATNPLKGYNISGGGKSTYVGLKHTEEFKRKISHLMSGRTVSQTTRDRLRAAQKKKSVIRIKGDERVVFQSIHDAAESVGAHPSCVSRACQNGKIYRDFTWSFERG